ncbi:MAG: hypothetical protein O3C10_08660 [Chloroflexi bacterium]|nr:hypothetical protein [Chloroflexota bacterium]
MTASVYIWVAIAIAGIVLAAMQLGDGLIVQRAEVRVPLFLGGAVIGVAGLLKFVAAVTDPEIRGSRD